MSLSVGETMQIIGGVLELGGLITVAVGISETRSSLTDQPSVLEKVKGFVHRSWLRISRLGTTIHPVSASGSADSGGHLSVQMQRRWRTDSEALLEQIKSVLHEHDQGIEELKRKLHEEVVSRSADLRKLKDELAAMETRIRSFIGEFAAGGLRREVVGVVLFGIGLVLQISGSLIS